jgi:hypothetical protein
LSKVPQTSLEKYRLKGIKDEKPEKFIEDR